MRKSRCRSRLRRERVLDSWDAWTEHLRARRHPVPIDRLIPSGNAPPLLWSLPDGMQQGARRGIVRRLLQFARANQPCARQIAELLQSWLSLAESDRAGPGRAVECLAWCHCLPRLSGVVPAGPWWELVERLRAAARAAEGIRLEDDPLVRQLLAGELPLTLAYLFPELDACRGLASAARSSLSRGVVELLDGQGLPASRHLGLLRPLLACWTRCALLSRAMPVPCFTQEARVQYEGLLWQSLRLMRADGSQVLSRGAAGAWNKRLFDAALELSGNREDGTIADAALPGRRLAKAVSPQQLPPPSLHSEWSQLAVLRSSWLRGAERLTVLHDGPSMRSELGCGRQTVWSGACSLQLAVDGQPLQPRDGWEEICWYSDEEVDYLELELKYLGGWRVQRQWLLARQDRFLLFADAVLGNQRCRIDYRCLLPLDRDIGFDAARESCEGVLYGKRRLGLVLPLALPEWRGQMSGDSLALVGHRLQLQERRAACRLYAPLFIDLNPRRFTRQFTWRRLTVGQKLEVQPDEVAVGYRVQVGSSHWLIYRSLAPGANRTVLGQNLCTEFFVGRFLRSGDVEPLVEVEPPEEVP